MIEPNIVTLPEHGQLVEVRRRQFVVTDVVRGASLDSPLYNGNGRTQTLVSLSSIEDDVLGEELQVVWEIEPGAHIYEEPALPVPVGFDDPRWFDAFLNAARWGAVSSADMTMLQAPFRSGIDIEDYQLDPVVRAIQMPRVNLLIGDDVGLRQDYRGGAGRPGDDHPLSGSAYPDCLSLIAANPMARPDPRQIRPGLPYCRQRADAGTAPHTRHPCPAVEPFSAPDHVD